MASPRQLSLREMFKEELLNQLKRLIKLDLPWTYVFRRNKLHRNLLEAIYWNRVENLLEFLNFLGAEIGSRHNPVYLEYCNNLVALISSFLTRYEHITVPQLQELRAKYPRAGMIINTIISDMGALSHEKHISTQIRNQNFQKIYEERFQKHCEQLSPHFDNVCLKVTEHCEKLRNEMLQLCREEYSPDKETIQRIGHEFSVATANERLLRYDFRSPDIQTKVESTADLFGGNLPEFESLIRLVAPEDAKEIFAIKARYDAEEVDRRQKRAARSTNASVTATLQSAPAGAAAAGPAVSPPPSYAESIKSAGPSVSSQKNPPPFEIISIRPRGMKSA